LIELFEGDRFVRSLVPEIITPVQAGPAFPFALRQIFIHDYIQFPVV